MRRSAIPLVFFVVMCSLNLLIAGCATTTARNAAKTTCHACEAHKMAAYSGIQPMLASYQQSATEAFPPTMDLIDSTITQALQEKGYSTSSYSRTGSVITYTLPDGNQHVITLDSQGRIQKVKRLNSNGQAVSEFVVNYGSYSAPLSLSNQTNSGPPILATFNYNSSQQLVSLTDNQTSVTTLAADPISPYPPLLYDVPPPAKAEKADAPVYPISPDVQNCYDGCKAQYDDAMAQAYSRLAIAVAAATAAYLVAIILCPPCTVVAMLAYGALLLAANRNFYNDSQTAMADYQNCLSECSVTYGLPPLSWKKHMPLPAVVVDPWDNDND